MPDFTAKIKAFAAKTKDRQNAIFKESAQRVIADMQTPVGEGGNMPIDTGFLRSSLVTTLNRPTADIQFNPDNQGSYRFDSSSYSLTIAGADIRDTIYATYTANYAKHVEYGVNGRPGRGFVRLASQKWPSIVGQVVSELS